MPSSDDESKQKPGARIYALPDPEPPRNLLELVRLVEAPEEDPPFSVDAIAVEEDTSLVLSADITVRDPQQHPIRLMTDLYAEQSNKPGELVVKGVNPVRLMAIVHDFEQDPSCREEWIAAALDRIFEECARCGFYSLGLEPLGTKHGRIPGEEFKQLLDTALRGAAPGELKRIWLIATD